MRGVERAKSCSEGLMETLTKMSPKASSNFLGGMSRLTTYSLSHQSIPGMDLIEKGMYRGAIHTFLPDVFVHVHDIFICP